MNNYGANIEEGEILAEQQTYVHKPPKFKKQTSYPYSSLPDDRDFERLLYLLFKDELKLNKTKTESNYDDVILMQGTKERGRDISLKLKSENVGLVQCKKYKNNLNKSQLGKEILKFVLFYLDDNKLISNTPDKFDYYIAVSSDIDEKGRNFISEVNDNKFEHDEIKKWVENLKKEFASFKKVNFDESKDNIIAALEKLNIEPIVCHDLDNKLNQYPDIASMFFEIDSVIDIETFEEILEKREKQEIKIIGSLNKVEKRLKQDFPHLFELVNKTKEKVQELMNQYSTHFIEYSEHNKYHSNNLGKLVSGLLLKEEQLNSLNEHDLYILANAFYLTDIGVCQSKETIKEKYYNNFTDSQKSNYSDSFENYIRRNHYRISFDFIKENSELLGIPQEYEEAVALVSQAHYSIQKNIEDRSIYNDEYTIDDTSTDTVCLPYLACLILVADNIDIENLNSDKLLCKFINYPNYPTSKRMWDEIKNKPKRQPVKDAEMLSLSGDINDQLLYLGVSEHLHILQEILKNCDKNLRKLPATTGRNKIPLKLIDDDLKSPFKDKLGLSIDYKSMIHTFFGKKIYKDEFVAIRELIQNSLDSCELKTKVEDGYTPEIIIELCDGKLIVKDNALGMDKYVVENYFAKLGSSYYCDNNVQNSIGQFGVGVFSYFMLCDSFTIETKTKQSNALKFIVNQEAPYQFYFYENSSLDEVDSGTKVIINLKNDIKLTFDELVKYVSTTFKHVKIPLTLKSNQKADVEIIHKDFDLNKDDVIEDCIQLPYRQDYSNHIEFYQFDIDNDEIEGKCGILFPKNTLKLKNIFPNDTSIKETYIQNKSGINVFQKGVFVKKQSSGFIGDFNVKKTKPLKINRDDFEENYFLLKTIDKLYIELTNTVFNSIANCSNKSELTLFYIQNYGAKLDENNTYDYLDNLFYLKVYQERYIEPLKKNFITYVDTSLGDLIKNFSEIGLIYYIQGQDWQDSFSKCLQKYKNPFVVTYTSLSFIENFFKNKGLYFTVVNESELSFLKLTKNNTDSCDNNIKDDDAIYGRVTKFCDNTLCSLLDKHVVSYFNLEHPIIKYWNENYFEIESDNEVLNIFNHILKELRDDLINTFSTQVSSSSSGKLYLSKYNPYLQEINQYLYTSFHLSNNDFPEWMHSKIVD